MKSLLEELAELPPSERDEVIAALSPEQIAEAAAAWRCRARPEQLAPDGDWDIWTILAGRGWGKTETGANWIKEQEQAGARSIALVAETQKDLEEVMVPRLLAICPEVEARFRPVRLRWPSGAQALGYNGTEPNQLRGPEFDTAWVDELAKYRYARETWDMLQFGMRRGLHPRTCITTTPRPIELIKSLIAGQEGRVTVTRGRTMDNAANLAPTFMERISKRYEGTRLGRQELDAEILGDLPGALWTLAALDAYRRRAAPEMGRIVVAVDPAVSDTDSSDEHGIIAAGMSKDGEGVVLEDASVRGSPGEWARRALSVHDQYGADGIVVEVNQGGDMVAHTLRTVRPNVNVIEVRATRGKHVRAEPVAALYEQGRIYHVGAFPELESQMVQMTTGGYRGDGSPDRLDALVWALSDLFPDMVDGVPDASRFDIPAMGRSSWMSA